MKDKNHGFTLVELIAIIVIISLLITISSTIFINVRFSVLEKNYENLKTYLETKAIEYANATGITKVNVETLIKEGYVTPDDNSDIILNPKDKTSLNCNTITLEFKDGEYDAVFNEDGISNTDEETGSCKDFEISKDYQICQIMNDDCMDIDNNIWLKEDITLGVKMINGTAIDDEATYYWHSTSGLTSKESSLTTNTYTINQNVYTVQITTKDGNGSASLKLNIDKQKPIITGVDIEDENKWTPSDKKATVLFSDLNGSGVDKYYVTNNFISSCSVNIEDYSNLSNDTYTSYYKNGTYYACVMDKVGNISDPYEFVIKMVDTVPTTPIITASDNLTTGSWHEGSFDLSFYSTNVNGSSITYYYGTTASNLRYRGNKVSIESDVYNVIYYVKACSESGLCSSIATYSVNSDLEKPVVTITEGNPSDWVKSTKIKATLSDTKSKLVAYAVTKSSTEPTSWTEISVTETYNYVSDEITDSSTYYIWAKDRAGNVGYASVRLSKVDNEPPVITNVYIEEDYCNGSSFRFYENYSYSESGSGIAGWYHKVTTSKTRPTSGYKDMSVGFNSLSCGVKYYLWIKLVDKAGNEGYGRSELPYSCNACAYDDSDDDYTPPTDSTKVHYDAYATCSNTNSCTALGYKTGKCEKVKYSTDSCAGSVYACYCCSDKDYLGNKITWDGNGQCVGV